MICNKYQVLDYKSFFHIINTLLNQKWVQIELIDNRTPQYWDTEYYICCNDPKTSCSRVTTPEVSDLWSTHLTGNVFPSTLFLNFTSGYPIWTETQNMLMLFQTQPLSCRSISVKHDLPATPKAGPDPFYMCIEDHIVLIPVNLGTILSFRMFLLGILHNYFTKTNMVL